MEWGIPVGGGVQQACKNIWLCEANNQKPTNNTDMNREQKSWFVDGGSI